MIQKVLSHQTIVIAIFLAQNFPFVVFLFFSRFERYCFHGNFLQEVGENTTLLPVLTGREGGRKEKKEEQIP